MPVITPHVPDGLIEIMKALAKGVLKDKPENIYEFAATHFEKLVFERDGRMDKGYENFRMDEDYFRYHEKYDFSDCKSLIKAKKRKATKKTGARPTNITIPKDTSEVISDKDILSPEPLQNKLKPRKLSCIKPSEGLISIQEEDGLDATSNAGATVENEKRQNAAAFTIQDYFKKLHRKKNNDSGGEDNTIQKAMTEESAAFIIQRTLKNMFGHRKDKNTTKMVEDNENGVSVTGSDVGDKKDDLLENDADRSEVSTVSADNLPEENESKVEKVLEVTNENLEGFDHKTRIHGEDNEKQANIIEAFTKDVDENNSKNMENRNDENEDKVSKGHEKEKSNKIGEIEANAVIEETFKKEKRPGSFSEALSIDETKDIIDRKPDGKIISGSQKKKKKSDDAEEENNKIDTDDKVDNKNSEKGIASNLTDSEKLEKMDDVLMVSNKVEKNKDSDGQNLKELSDIVNEATDKPDSSNVVHADSGKKSPKIENKTEVHNLKGTTDINVDDSEKPEEDNGDDITSTKSFEQFVSEPGRRSVMEGQNIVDDSDTPNMGGDENEKITSETENKNDENNVLKTLEPIMAKIDDKVNVTESEIIIKDSGIDDLKRQKSQTDIKKTKDQSEPGHDNQSTDLEDEAKAATNTENGLSKNEGNLEIDNQSKNVESETEKVIKSQMQTKNKEENKNTENMNALNREEMAAVVIQKTFRGYQTRKPLVENKKSKDIETGSSDDITKEESDVKNANQTALDKDKNITSDDTDINDENGAPSLQKAKSKDKLQKTADGIKKTKEDDDANDENHKQTIYEEDKNTSAEDSKVHAENEAPLIKKNISKDHSKPENDIQSADIDDESKGLVKTQIELKKSKANLEDDNQIHFGYHLPKPEKSDVEPIKMQVEDTNKEDNKKLNELNNEELAKAAIKIQTLFRGYLSRNNIDVRKKLDSGAVDNEILRLAALVIQKTFRGYQARKSLEACKNARDMQTGVKPVVINEEIPDIKTSNQTVVGEDTNMPSEARNDDETEVSLLQKNKSKDKLQEDTVEAEHVKKNSRENDAKKPGEIDLGVTVSGVIISKIDDENIKKKEEKTDADEDSLKLGQTIYDIDGIAQSESAESALDKTNKDEEEKNTINNDSSKPGQTIYDIDGIAQTESVGSPLEKPNKNEVTDTNTNNKEVYDIDGNTKSEKVGPILTKLNKNGVHDTNSNPKEIYDIDGNIKSESVGPTLENLENINKNGVVIDTNSHPKDRYDIDGSLINPEYQPAEKLVRQTKNLEMLKTDGILSDQEEITEIEDEKSGSCREDDPNNVGQTSSSAGLLPQDSSQTKEETLDADEDGVNRKGVWYVGSEPIITSQSQDNENEGNDNLEEGKGGENVDKNLEGNDNEEKAAIQIQKSYRGYRARRDVSCMKNDDKTVNPLEDATIMTMFPANENEDKAALQIQKSYRGYKTRKAIHHDAAYSNNEAMSEADGNLANIRIEDDTTADEGKGIEDNNITQDKSGKESSNKADEEKAAVQIQKSYRGYKTRKDLHHGTPEVNNKTSVQDDENKEKSENENNNEPALEKVLAKGLENTMIMFPANENEDKAALQIQKIFRGYKTRKDLNHGNVNEGNFEKVTIKNQTSEKEIKDGTLSDEARDKEVLHQDGGDKEKAAVQIQKSYRGYKSRKDIRKENHEKNKEIISDNDVDKPDSEDSIKAVEHANKLTSDIDKNENEIVADSLQKQIQNEKAALQIQKTYRGYRSRKDLKQGNEPDNSHTLYQGGTSDTTDQAEETDKKDIDTENKNDEEKAAVHIQKSYRGYRSRKTVKYGNTPEDSHASAHGGNSDTTDQAEEIAEKDNNTENNNEEVKAAVQIQKSYRGYRSRKSVKNGNKPDDSHVVAQRGTSDTTDQAEETSKEDIDTETKNDEEKAAVQIQKSYRGYRSRRAGKHGNKMEDGHTLALGNTSDTTDQAEETGKKDNDTEIKNDEEKAAVQIQKSYRGYRSRKTVKHGNKIEDGYTPALADTSDTTDHAEETGKKDNETENKNDEAKAAVQIQKSYRGYRSRKAGKHGNKMEDGHTSALGDTSDTTDQAEETGKKDNDTENKNDEEKAAVQIQKSYRGYRSRKTVKHGNKIEDGHTPALADTSDTTDHAEVTGKKDNETENKNDEEKAAVQIQKSYRGYRSRKAVKHANKTKDSHAPAQGDTSDTTDQAEETGKKDNKAENKNDEAKAAVQIQKSYRGYRSRKAGKHGNKMEDGHTPAPGDTSDTTDQAEETGKKDNDTENKNDEEKAAVQIQKSYRGYRSRKTVKHGNKIEDGHTPAVADTSDTTDHAEVTGKKDNETENKNDEEKAAVQIQKSYRGYRSRKAVKHANEKKDSHAPAQGDTYDTTDQAEETGKKDNEAENKNDEAKAAVQIQKSYRGYRSRKAGKHGNKMEDGHTPAPGDTSDTTDQAEETGKKDNENKNDEEKAAVQIQKSYRGYRSRKTVKHGNKIEDGHTPALADTSDTTDHAEVTGKKDNETENKNDEEKAAVQIQKSYRGYRSRKAVKHANKTKDSHAPAQGDTSDTTDQAEETGKKDNDTENKNDEEKAAVQIQKSYRGYRSRKTVKHGNKIEDGHTPPLGDTSDTADQSEETGKKDNYTENENDEEKAAVQIQKSYRGYRSRKPVKRGNKMEDGHTPALGDTSETTDQAEETGKKDNDTENKNNEEKAAVQIQKSYRGYRSRKTVKHGNKPENNHAAVQGVTSDTTDQAGETGEKDIDSENKNYEEKAAVQIQKSYRGYRSRKSFKHSNKIEDSHVVVQEDTSDTTDQAEETSKTDNDTGIKNDEEKAAVQIQKSYRGYRSRKAVKHDNKVEDSHTEVHSDTSDTTDQAEKVNKKYYNTENKSDEDKAALQIQKTYRGYRSRKHGKPGNMPGDGDTVSQEDNSVTTDQVEETCKKDNDTGNENDEEKAAVQIQKSYRGYRSRKHVKNSNKTDDKNIAAKGGISDTAYETEKKKKKDSDAENKKNQEEAALLIQKSYREYSSRKGHKSDCASNKQISLTNTELDKNIEVFVSGKENDFEKPNDDKADHENAALKIQKSYRGYRARKDINHKKDVSDPKSTVNNNVVDDKEEGTVVNDEKGKDLRKGELQADKKEPENEEGQTPEEFVDQIVTLSKEQAALQIQKCYRGYRTRSDLQNGKLTAINPSHGLLLPKMELSLEDESSNKDDADKLSIVNEEEFEDQDVGCQDKKPKDEEEAALQIQKTYRGYRSRKELKTEMDKQPVVNSRKEVAHAIEPSAEETLDHKQDTTRENEGDHDTAVSKPSSAHTPSEDEAALQIQKSYRGYVTRKNLHSKDTEAKGKVVDDDQTDNKENKLLDEETDVGEENKAAIQIQKSYRGYRARRDLQGQMNPVSLSGDELDEKLARYSVAPADEDLAVKKEVSVINISENISSEDEAALKIQKSYRGYKVRKDIQNEKKSTKGSDISEKTEDDHVDADKERKNTTEAELSQISRNNSINDLIKGKQNKDADLVGTQKDIDTKDLSNDDDDKTEHMEYIRNDNLERNDTGEGNIEMGKTVVLSKSYLPLPTRGNRKVDRSDLLPSNSKAGIPKLSDIQGTDNLQEVPINIQKNPDSSAQEQELTDSNENLKKTELKIEQPNNEHEKDKETSPALDATYITTPSTALVSDLDTPGIGTAQNLRNLTADEAATQIQKSYRMYKARRQTAPVYKQRIPVDEDFYKAPDGEHNVDTFNVEEEKAAIEIQKTYRGYRVRRDLNRQITPIKTAPPNQPDFVSDSGISSTNQSDVDTSSTLHSDGETVRYDEPQESESGKPADSQMKSSVIQEEPFIEKRYSVANQENGSKRDLSSADSADSVRQSSQTTIPDNLSDIEKIDISAYGEDSLEAMYYSLRKNELMLDKMHQRASEHKSAGKQRSNTMPFEDTAPVKNMDEIQKENIPADDAVIKDGKSLASEESRPETAIRKSGISKSKKDSNSTSNDEDELDDDEDDDDADDIDDITSDAIRRNMLAYSVSEADSDYYEIAAEKTNAIRDDFNISTAFENITSSDTDSTIVSAATKIQAGARGFLTRRRLRRASLGTSSFSERRASFGNAAIGKSLDDLIEQQEQIGMDEAASRIQKSFRRYKKRKTHQSTPLLRDSTDDTLSSKNNSDEGIVGITDVKLQQKAFQVLSSSDSSEPDTQQQESGTSGRKKDISDSNEGSKSSDILSPQGTSRSGSAENEKHANLRSVNFDGLNLAARRMTLQRGDAVQRHSTPEEENGNNSAVAAVPVDAETGEIKAPNKKKTVKPSRIARLLGLGTRQRTMPVQIDSEIMRIIPKHLRKRIKSADVEKKKRNQLF